MQYPAHDAFVAPARQKPQVWRLLLGLVLVLIVYVASIALIFLILALLSGFEGAQIWLQRMQNDGTPTSGLILLATFIGMGLGAFLAARWLHARRAGTLFGPRRRTIRDFLVGLAVCAVVYGVFALVPSEAEPSPNLPIGLWLSFLPIALLGVLVQTGAEEVLFRGYIQQQLAARFASPLIWIFAPAILFALGHFQPDIMGENAWIVVFAAALFGVAAADLTAKTGSIGAAWGFHFANNCVAILVVSMEGPLSGLSLYSMPFTDMGSADMRPMLYLNLAITIAVWLLIRIAVSRLPHR